MKAYKGFDKDMTCHGFQFEEGQTYREDHAEMCVCGFHACENPLDCFGYYNPGSSVYHEVELEEVAGEKDNSLDFNDTKRCGKVIKIGAALDVAGICEAHFEYTKSRCTPSDSRVAGEYGSAAAGEYGSAAAGYRGSAASRRSSSVGKQGIAAARGDKPKAKGGLGAVLVIAKEKPDSYDIADWCAGVVDGEKIKADTWYTVKDGQFVEVGK